MSRFRIYQEKTEVKDKQLKLYEEHLKQACTTFNGWEETLGFSYEDLMDFCTVITGNNSIIIYYIDKQQRPFVWSFMHNSYIGAKNHAIHDDIEGNPTVHQVKTRRHLLIMLLRSAHGPIFFEDTENMWDRNQIWEQLGFNGPAFKRCKYGELNKTIRERGIPHADMGYVHKVLTLDDLTIVVFDYRIGAYLGKVRAYSQTGWVNTSERCNLYKGNVLIDWETNTGGDSMSEYTVYRSSKAIEILKEGGYTIPMSNFEGCIWMYKPNNQLFAPLFARE